MNSNNRVHSSTLLPPERPVLTGVAQWIRRSLTAIAASYPLLRTIEESYLCQRCRSVDWDAAFAPLPRTRKVLKLRSFLDTRPDERTVLKFRSTLEIRPDSRCRMCLAIAFLFGLEDVEPTEELDPRFALVAVRSAPNERNCPTWMIGMEYSEDEPQHGYWLANFPRRHIMEPSECGFEFGTPRGTVDFDRLRRWLSDCRRGEPCARPLDLPGMRAIDCKLREIVPLPVACPEYATLSYVWGQAGAPCTTDGKLSNRLPLTIEDSITVCRELGVRYLWVDRYCIQESHKHALIRSMHRIYRESQFTIVAAAGCGPEYGLPGVSSTPRSATIATDHSIRVGARQLLCIDDLDSRLKRSAQQTADSRWAKRGWTLQEGMLSKRLCIFLDDQVHLETDVGAQSERISPCERTGLGPKMTYTSPSDYWQTVSAFCSRDLSYPEDVLNAMSGILSTWTQNTRTFRHISGLAMHYDPKRGRKSVNSFPGSLAWRVSGPVTRRRGFPSWNWTGWLTPNVLQKETSVSESACCLRSVETDGGDIIYYSQLLDLLEAQHGLLDTVKILHITALVIDICIGPSDSVPSIDQDLCGDQKLKSEWRAMIVLNGKETVYECEVTRLVTKDDMYPLTHRQHIQCKGLVIQVLPKRSGCQFSDLYILIVVWDEDGGYYERFGMFGMPETCPVKMEIETIRLG